MIAVVIEWNTDEKSEWIDQKDRVSIPGEKELDYPLSIVGPFETEEESVEWMSDALPDNTDVFDMYTVDREFPEEWYIADPKEFPDGYFRPFGESDQAIITLVLEPPMPVQPPLRSVS